MMEMVARCSGPEILETLLAADLKPMEATAVQVAETAVVMGIRSHPAMSAKPTIRLVLNLQ